MDIENMKEKVKAVNWKNVFLSRNFIIVCAVLLIGAGVIVFSLTTGSNTVPPAADSGTKVLGNTVLVGNEVSGQENAEAQASTDSYFAVAVINRQRTRDEAMETLQTIADSPDAMPNEKEKALESISSLVKEMEAEANIETLVKAKGFSQCVAIYSGNKCSVIVESEGLLTDEVAQILAIAVEQTGLKASGIVIQPFSSTPKTETSKEANA